MQQHLPIFEKRDEIRAALERHRVVVVAGETGSGKTTQLPQYLYEWGIAGKGLIAVTQPRRIAATSLARRVASEMGCEVGSIVGHRVRFDEKVGDNSKIVFMTDGMLLTDIRSDRFLMKYGVIVIDEAHERSLNIDFLLGYLRKLLKKRSDLKVVISSATINTALFSASFDNAPIVEVSGRLFPVSVQYAPPEEFKKDDEDDPSYVDAAVRCIDMIAESGEQGDVLVFMPTERDILETVQALRGARLYGSEILSLFSRQTSAEQNRIFSTGGKRKIIVSTNIAETSLTVPGIKFVIDSGLVRMKRYAPRLRTNRLPIEKIARASADQRKGRCGRVSDGVCFRLYTEEDYSTRVGFTTPEIKRSNLAGIILTMITQGLGDIRSFPFLEPPLDKAINEGFKQLFELGALDRQHRLTDAGRSMARLPLDPHIARMLIEAQKENVMRDVAIIAAGLSIVDPRERPAEKAKEADAAHKQFADEKSDFVTLLNIWDAWDETWRTLKTQTQVRKFCTAHFLNFNRMTEWHEVHHQIIAGLRQNGTIVGAVRTSDNDAIHRSILSGLVSSIARKKKDGGYTAGRGQEAAIFPGSVLHKKEPEWIVAHEIVETSRIFARGVAPIDPRWVEQVAPHLCTRTISDPVFEQEGMYVAARETISCMGLPLLSRRVNYGSIDASKANDVFIRQGLIEGLLEADLGFLDHNDRTIEEAESAEAKLRTRGFLAEDEVLYTFYKQRIPDLSSLNDLKKLIRQRSGDAFLRMTIEDVIAQAIPEEAAAFPDKMDIGGKAFPLQYVFEPGSEKDGVTVSVPAEDAPYLSQDLFGWIVPALWPEKITELLRTLPKSVRKNFVPAPEYGKKIAAVLKYSQRPFNDAVADVIQKSFGMKVDPSDFNEDLIPLHLRMRVAVVDKKGKTIVAGRGLDIAQESKQAQITAAGGRLQRVYAAHEKDNVSFDSIPEIPQQITVGSSEQGFDLFAYPALTKESDAVHLRCYPEPLEAERAHWLGVFTLIEHALAEDLAWLEKEIKFPQSLKVRIAPLGSPDEARTSLVKMATAGLLAPPYPAPRKKEQFDALVKERKVKLTGAGNKTCEMVAALLDGYTEARAMIEKSSSRVGSSGVYAGLKKELLKAADEWVLSIIKGTVSWDMFCQYHRYLRAFRYRCERAFADPLKYHAKWDHLAAYQKRIDALDIPDKKSDPVHQIHLDELRLILAEYTVSLFAQQEVKALFAVSEKRMEKAIADRE